MEPNIYQRTIFHEIKYGKKNLIVEAVAGSGKTTTIVEALNLIPDNKRTLFCAFNKHIAEELSARVPMHIQVSTLNSFGHKILCRNGSVKVNDRKTYNLLKYKVLKNHKDFKKLVHPIMKLVSLLKAQGESHFTRENCKFLMDRYDVITDQLEEVIIHSLTTFQLGLEQTNIIDFNDQTATGPGYRITTFDRPLENLS